VAAVFGILSAALMFAFLNSRGGDGGSEIDDAINSGNGAESVVVAAQPIEAGQTITAEMLTVKTVPATALLEGRYQNIADLEGKVAVVPILPDEQVVDAKVSRDDHQTTLAFKVPEGLRALGLEVPHEAWIVGGLPQPGDRVDIIGITVLTRVDPLTGQEEPDLTSGIIAQDVEVLAMRQKVIGTVPKTDTATDATTPVEGSATPSAEGTPLATEATDAAAPFDTGETFETAISVTLALTPELAAKVAMIDALKDDVGQYRLIVRHRGDDAPLTGEVVWTLEQVFPTSAR
jgi:Flp pilus assembly protein CpaB